MAVKDGKKYLRTAIDSILSQTFSDFEFIIIDDGSRDTTSEIIHEYLDSRIVFLSNQSSQGLSKSLNVGLKRACGTYTARMDADDVSLPNRLELQVNYLDAHLDVAVLGTGCSFIDTNGLPLQNIHFPLSHEIIAWSLPFFNPIVHPSVMMRTSVIKTLGGYDPELRRSQDYDLWWRMSFLSKLANLEETLVLLRQHQAQVSREHSSDQLAQGIEINAKHLSKAMHQNISGNLIKKMWAGESSSIKDAIDMGNLIWKWCRINIPNAKSSSSKMYIINDALNRINALISPFSGDYRLLPLLIKLYLLGNAKKYST